MSLPLHRDSFFIDGKWVKPLSSETITIISPRTEEPVGSCPGAGEQDIEAAVAAARKAFDQTDWAYLPVATRAEYLHKIAAYLRERGPEIAELISTEMGGPMARLGKAPSAPADLCDHFADIAPGLSWIEERAGLMGPAIVRREAVGVVAAITPWNGPLTLLLMKFAPALVAGCTIVAKPSPEAPLDAYVLADACEAAGLPAGVFNLVPGGREAGDFLVRHRGVDKVAFTGSTAAGRKIGEACGRDIRRVALELGGKSAAVALADASAEVVAHHAVNFGLAFNSGQACAALTRVVVPRSRLQEFTDAMAAEMSKLVTGDPLDAASNVGPMVAERQRTRIEGLIGAGKSEGAKLVVGGGRPAGLSRGWYVEPTLFTDVSNTMTIAREEIFGPVGVIIPYDGGDAEAVAIANDTPYGLAGAVFSADVARGYEAVKRVRAGTMGLNTFYMDPRLPFGGFKESGIGRENGADGIYAYTEMKTVLGVSPEVARG